MPKAYLYTYSSREWVSGMSIRVGLCPHEWPGVLNGPRARPINKYLFYTYLKTWLVLICDLDRTFSVFAQGINSSYSFTSGLTFWSYTKNENKRMRSIIQSFFTQSAKLEYISLIFRKVLTQHMGYFLSCMCVKLYTSIIKHTNLFLTNIKIYFLHDLVSYCKYWHVKE
jgi:hypothetical protein